MALAALAGVLFKVYDDLVDDVPILTNPYTTTTLQLLQVTVFAIVAHANFAMSLVFALFNGAAALASWSEYSRPHVWAYFWICPLLLLTSFRSRTPFTLFDYPIAYGYVAYGLVEPRLFPEDVSVSKFISRALATYLTVVCLFLLRASISPAMQELLALSSGYGLASSVLQMLSLAGLLRASPPTPA